MQRYSGVKGTETARNHTKKKTRRYREQKPEKVAAYQEKIADIPSEKIAYVDETGLDRFYAREYAYAPRGKTVEGLVPGRKFQRTNLVAAQMGHEVLAPMQYQGTTNAALFESWFEQCLLPCLPKDAVIVMDNAAFHRKKRLFEIAERFQLTLIFLPPYSPELNPIEKLWAWLKRKIASFVSGFSSLDDAISFAFQVR